MKKRKLKITLNNIIKMNELTKPLPNNIITINMVIIIKNQNLVIMFKVLFYYSIKK